LSKRSRIWIEVHVGTSTDGAAVVNDVEKRWSRRCPVSEVTWRQWLDALLVWWRRLTCVFHT